MDRILVWTAAGLAAGIAAAQSGPLVLAAVLLLGGVSLAITQHHRHAYRQHLTLALLFCGMGALQWTLRHPEAQADTLRHMAVRQPGQVWLLEGVVRQAPLIFSDTEYARFLLDVDRVESAQGSQSIHGRVLVRWTAPDRALYSGERVRLRARLSPRLGAVNLGVRGVEDHYRAQAVHSAASIRGSAVAWLGAPRVSIIYWASRLRAAEAEILRDTVPAWALPFLLTVWLGERGQISQPAYEDFLASGTAHILAVSGVHVGLVFLSAQFLLGSFLKSPRLRAMLILLIVISFALAAGARVSSLRAAAMVALYVGADLLRRERDAPTALAVAAIALLFVNPMSLFDPGFLLSFSSVASLLLFVPALQHLLPEDADWKRYVAPPLAVQVLPTPLALNQFHVLPLLSPLVNLAVIPLLTGVLWLTFLTVVLGTLSTGVGSIFGHAAGVLVGVISLIARWAAQMPGSHALVSSPSGTGLFFYYLSAACLLVGCIQKGRGRRLAPVPQEVRPHRVLLAGAGCTLILALLLWRPGTIAAVDFLDVGHGDSTLVRTPAGGTLLVDAGDASEYVDVGKQVVRPFLLSHGVTRLDILAVSHADRDHMGGVFSVLRSIRVGEVILGPPSGTPLEEALLALCTMRGIPVRRIFAGDTLTLPGAEAEVLHPAEDWSGGINDSSLVLRVRWPGMDLLLAGDIERAGEAQLAGSDCTAALLKVPHHGSDTSSTLAFLETVRPRVAVMSVLPRGTFRTGHHSVMERYEALGTRVWRTDVHGGVRVHTFPGAGLAVVGAREERGTLLE